METKYDLQGHSSVEYEINMPYKTIFEYVPPEEIVDEEIRQSLMKMNTFEIFHFSCDNFCFELQIADDKVKKKTTVKWHRKFIYKKCKKPGGPNIVQQDTRKYFKITK